MLEDEGVLGKAVKNVIGDHQQRALPPLTPVRIRHGFFAGAEQLDQSDQGDLGGVAAIVEHRLAGEEPAGGHPVEAAGQLPVGGPRLHRVSPAEPVQA